MTYIRRWPVFLLVFDVFPSPLIRPPFLIINKTYYIPVHSMKSPPFRSSLFFRLSNTLRETSFNGDISGWDTSSVTSMAVRALALAVIYIIPRRTPRIPSIFDSESIHRL